MLRYQEVFDAIFSGRQFAPPDQLSLMLSLLDDIEAQQVFRLFTERWRDHNAWSRFNMWWPCCRCEKRFSCMGSGDVCDYVFVFSQRLRGIGKIMLCSFCCIPFLTMAIESVCPDCMARLSVIDPMAKAGGLSSGF